MHFMFYDLVLCRRRSLENIVCYHSFNKLCNTNTHCMTVSQTMECTV